MELRHSVAFAMATSAAACGPSQPKDAPPPPPLPPLSAVASDAVPAVTGAACAVDALPTRYPAPPGRLVAIGDIHGDLAAARSALRAAGAIGAHDDAWIGGDLWIVQTGDILDRGDDEQAIIDLFAALEPAAAKAGGKVIVLDGNHELMNALADFRYVTPGGFADFADAPGLPDLAAFTQVPLEARARVAALMPGGPYARIEAHHGVVAIVGDWVFSHAGVLGDWVTRLDEENRAARCFLSGQTHEPPTVAKAEDGPVWTRALGGPTVDCAPLTAALTALKVTGEVVGHTVQPHANAQCAGTLWRIDVGLAKLYQGPIEVLEVYPTPKVLTGTR